MKFDANLKRKAIVEIIDSLRRKIKPTSTFVHNCSDYYTELANAFFGPNKNLHETVIELFHFTLLSLVGDDDLGKLEYWFNYRPSIDNYVVTAEQTQKFVREGTDDVYALLYSYVGEKQSWRKKALTVHRDGNADLVYFYYSKFFTKKAIDSGIIISFHDVLTSDIQGVFSQRVNDRIEWSILTGNSIEKYYDRDPNLLRFFHNDEMVLKNYMSYMERILGVSDALPLPNYLTNEEFGNRSEAEITPISFYIWNLSNPYIANHVGTFIIASEKPISDTIMECMSKVIVIVQLIVAAIKETEVLYLNYHHSFKRLHSAIQSAIGSIMSRNGSHNIGSHVLSALSHNVGTMPEDRKLYQYIQHRMDYIATATTDFPVWRQPTLLVSDMMRTFLSQTHLLNYISGSEGLHAYQFQNPTVDPSAQHETIKLHVRRVREWEYEPAASDCDYGEGLPDEIDARAIVYNGKTNGVSDFIVYPDEKDKYPDSFDKDLSVAIPGGVVGQHAFFTILENLIRNAAKHEWSKATWSKPEDKDKPDAVYKDQSDLEVYVDFRDNPQEGVVEMLVWNDRVGKASSGMGKTVKSLTDKIKSSFISPETGELVRENWGLAEMRISAGFLKHAEIDTIGGIGEKEGAAIDLVRPVVVRHGDKECLGFRFDFLKPKELLVVVSDDVEENSIQSANGILSRFGIEMMRMEDALKSKGLAYSYVLIDGFDFKRSENEWPKLPFRVLSPTDYSTDVDSVAARRVALYDGDLYHSQNGEDFPAKIKRLVDEWNDGANATVFAHNLLEDVYACWVDHVRKARGVSKEAPLIVDVAGGEGGSAKSLVTDSDLIHYVFEHSFNSAVRSYLETVREKDIDPQLAGALYSLIMLDTRPIMSVNDFLNCRCPSGLQVDENEYKVVIQLVVLSEKALEKLPTTIDVRKRDRDGNSYVSARWVARLHDLATKKCLVYLYAGLKAVRAGGTGGDVGNFVRYLCKTVLGQARAFLSKYEERVVTLPPSFGAKKAPTGTSDILWSRERDNQKVLAGIVSSDRSKVKLILADSVSKGGVNAKGMCYLRHGDESSNPAEGKTCESALKSLSQYLEPLSGSQSYLNSLIAFQQNIGHLSRKCSDERLFAIREMAGMVENSLMRILLIDERATKFSKDHVEVARVFTDIGIFVCDENNPMVAELADSKFDGFADSAKQIPTKDCEIAVIHQGIIDKILKDHPEKTVESFLEDLTKNLRHVVVTTGRGTPANIPDTARVLPFSVVESTLFKRYPEKILLVDTIMNILPGKEVKR